MKPRKPLKLLFNLKLWMKLEPYVLNENNYVFVVKKNDDTYSCLYDKKGKLLLDSDFKIDSCYKEYLFIVKKGYYDDPSRSLFNIFDSESGKKTYEITVDSPKPDMGVLCFEYEGYPTVWIESNKYIITNLEGSVVTESASSFEAREDVLLCKIRNLTHIVTKYFEDWYDVIVRTKLTNKDMYLAGKIEGNEFVYQAIGSKGYRPSEFYFKKCIEIEDGIFVKPCTSKGKVLKDIAFIDRELGKVLCFEDALTVTSYKAKRFFVTRKAPSTSKDDDYDKVVQLWDNNGVIIDEYKDVYYGFEKIQYGVFEETFAIARDKDDNLFFIDTNGRHYPIPNGYTSDLNAYQSVSSNLMMFKDPLN